MVKTVDAAVSFNLTAKHECELHVSKDDAESSLRLISKKDKVHR